MARNDNTSALIDGILRFVMAGGSIALGMLAPNIIQVLDKPLIRYLDKLDRRSRDREVRRVVNYMKNQGLIEYNTKSYEHGLVLTAKGKGRAALIDPTEIKVKKYKYWDKRWRLILYDVPQSYKSSRDAFKSFLSSTGFHQLQKSVWLFPFPCRREISLISSRYGINQFVTYIETAHIDREDLLIKRFFKSTRIRNKA